MDSRVPINLDPETARKYIELQTKYIEWNMFCEKTFFYLIIFGIALFILIGLFKD